MRPDVVFSDSSVSPSFFFTTLAKKPRTECGCQPVTFEIAAMVVPPLDRSRPRTRSCLVVPLLERDAVCVFVFDLSCFAGLVRGCLVLNLAIKDLRGRRHHRRTTSTPLRSATRGVRSQGAATAPPGFTSNAPFATEVQSNIEQSCCSTVTAYDSECRQNEPIYGETRNKVAQSREITLGGDCQLRPVVQTLLVLLLQAHLRLRCQGNRLYFRSLYDRAKAGRLQGHRSCDRPASLLYFNESVPKARRGSPGASWASARGSARTARPSQEKSISGARRHSRRLNW